MELIILDIYLVVTACCATASSDACPALMRQMFDTNYLLWQFVRFCLGRTHQSQRRAIQSDRHSNNTSLHKPSVDVVQSPSMTSVTCVVEDGGGLHSGIINKAPLSLADIKAALHITQQDGVYLAKTQDGHDSYHWSIIVNDQDIVPNLLDGSISIKVRPTFPGLLLSTFVLSFIFFSSL